MANLQLSITLLMTIIVVAMVPSAYGQATAAAAPAAPFCHTSAYTLDCAAVTAAKTVLLASTECNPTGSIKLAGPYAPANGCTCTVKQTAPSEAEWTVYNKCEKVQPAYVPLKSVACQAGKKDGACNV